MRRAWIAILAGLILFGSLATTATAEVKQAGPGALAGSQAALKEALSAPTAVRYQILVFDGLVEDRTGFLDKYLADNGWPESNTLLLLVFPRHNHDIRFAMGTGLTQAGMTLEEMLGIVRQLYFAVVAKGDPARAMVELIEAVNRRMAPVGSTLPREPVKEKPVQKPEPKPLPPARPPVKANSDVLARDPFAFLTIKVGGQVGGTVSYEREPTVGEMMVRTTRQVDEARKFAGNGLVLPPGLEGKEIYLVEETDKNGELLMLAVNVPEAEFWARYRPAGDHLLKISLSGGLIVTTEPHLIEGRPARLLRLDAEGSGKHYAHLYLVDGNWIYELHETAARGDNLLALAGQMK